MLTGVKLLVEGLARGLSATIGVTMLAAYAQGLKDGEALQWLHEQGWGVQDDEASVRAHVDFIGTRTFLVGRNWQTTTAVNTDADSYDPDLVHVCFVVKGCLFLQAGGETTEEVPAPYFFTYSARRPVRISAVDPYSCLFLGIPRERYVELAWVESQAPGPFLTTSRFRKVLIASLNASFESQIKEGQVGFHSWRRGVEDLLLATLADTNVRQSTNGQSPRDLHLARAHHLIEENFRDPAFSVRVLARDLNISLSQLHRIFADESNSVGVFIRRLRVERARTLLRSSDNSKSDRYRIAQESGFRSMRTMRRLLSQESAERKPAGD
ncbi:helix-turn-helix domain-containing protein [Pseudoclavibacter sp. Z016]|uniref:helix-turn-helix domain-containing protein n=1 Tax=Pseudoclavibacter sp. Z016 TaxID=2080581 RepID=UPI0011B02FF8|nr:AraC family transcriptional regulator [Pseudoclavibacter sp. Z016]